MVANVLLVGTMVLFLALPSSVTELHSGPSELEGVRDIAELAWHAAAASSKCTVECWDQHENNQHIAFPDGTTNEIGAGAHEFIAAGLCAQKHPSCGGGGPIGSLERLQQAIYAMDHSSLKDVLQEGGIVFHFAEERGALQVIGCAGEIVAHYALPRAMQAALAD